MALLLFLQNSDMQDCVMEHKAVVWYYVQLAKITGLCEQGVPCKGTELYEGKDGS